MDLHSFPSKAAHFWLSLRRCTKRCTHKTFALFNFPFIPNVTKCKIGSHCAFKIFLCRLNLQGLIILKSASRSCQNAVCSIPRKVLRGGTSNEPSDQKWIFALPQKYLLLNACRWPHEHGECVRRETGEYFALECDQFVFRSAQIPVPADLLEN